MLGVWSEIQKGISFGMRSFINDDGMHQKNVFVWIKQNRNRPRKADLCACGNGLFCNTSGIAFFHNTSLSTQKQFG